jgi:hypothetical protein
VLARAEAAPGWLWLGLDAAADGMAAASNVAARRLPNALFVRAAAEGLPPELAGLAAMVTLNFPWGSLLRDAVRPHALGPALGRLTREGATAVIRFSVDPARDAVELERLGLAPADLEPRALEDAWRLAGWTGTARVLAAHEVRALPTTWARRLAADPAGRRFVELQLERGVSP